MYALGLMSGTSADGVDAVLAEFRGSPSKPIWNLINLVSIPYPNDLRKILVEIAQGLKISSREIIELARDITEFYFKAALECDLQGQSELVGWHGQTVYHRPPSKGKRGASLQLLQAPLLAQLLKCPVIESNFNCLKFKPFIIIIFV